MSFCGSNATTTASRYSPSRRSTRGSFIPATTWAFVTTRFGAATQPEPPTPRPHAVPTTRKTLSLARRTPGLASSAGSGRDAAPAPGSPERVDPRDRVEQPRRRDALVDLAEDPRPLHLLASCPGPAGAAPPRPRPTRSPRRRGAEHEAAEQSRAAAAAGRRGSTGSRCPPSPRRSGAGARARARRRRDERRVRRLAPGEELGRQLGAEVRAGEDPGERGAPPISPRRSPFSAASAITPAAIQSTLVTAASRRGRRRGHAPVLLPDLLRTVARVVRERLDEPQLAVVLPQVVTLEVDV